MPQADLAREGGVRLMLSAVSGNWRSMASGLRAWSHDCDTMWPCVPHFPAAHIPPLGFAALFDNPGTLGRYVSHRMHRAMFAAILYHRQFCALVRQASVAMESLRKHTLPLLRGSGRSRSWPPGASASSRRLEPEARTRMTIPASRRDCFPHRGATWWLRPLPPSLSARRRVKILVGDPCVACEH